MPEPKVYRLVLDVEAMGLHGVGFAVGAVVVDGAGVEVASLYACAPRASLPARAEDVQWLHENLPALTTTHETPRDVRSAFWAFWRDWREQGAEVWADCGWPVEARFLAACVEDHPSRWWSGPYPLHEIATLIGLATHERLPNELPVHNPLNDARQSARLLVAALRARSDG